MFKGVKSSNCLYVTRPYYRCRICLTCKAQVASGSQAVTHTVKPGDTLWDLARHYNVTVTSIREANAISSKSDVISEGQVLKIPLEKLEQKDHVEKPVGSQHPSFLRQMEATASNLRELLAGKQASSKLEAESLENEERERSAPASGSAGPVPGSSGCQASAFMTPEQRRKCPDLWASPSSQVGGITVDDCEQMLYDNMHGGLEKDVLLVVYAPWCPFCKDIESSVEQLAAGVRHDSTVSVLKLRGDSAASRLWLRAQLGVESFPAIFGFPKDGGGPLRYIGPRDTTSLLEFMNVHFRTLTIGAKPIRMASAGSLLRGSSPYQPPVLAGTTPTGINWILGLMVTAAVAVVAVAAKLMRRSRSADDAAVEKVKKTCRAEDSGAGTTEAAELDQSILKLLKLLGELLLLRVSVMWGNLACLLRRLARFMSFGWSPAASEGPRSAPGEAQHAKAQGDSSAPEGGSSRPS